MDATYTKRIIIDTMNNFMPINLTTQLRRTNPLTSVTFKLTQDEIENLNSFTSIHFLKNFSTKKIPDHGQSPSDTQRSMNTNLIQTLLDNKRRKCSHDLFYELSTQRKKNNSLTAEKLGRHCVHQMTKANATNTGTQCSVWVARWVKRPALDFSLRS